ncbi:hypothetical protein GCM10010505_43980 [Kitasatospora aburaviensis]
MGLVVVVGAGAAGAVADTVGGLPFGGSEKQVGDGLGGDVHRSLHGSVDLRAVKRGRRPRVGACRRSGGPSGARGGTVTVGLKVVAGVTVRT